MCVLVVTLFLVEKDYIENSQDFTVYLCSGLWQLNKLILFMDMATKEIMFSKGLNHYTRFHHVGLRKGAYFLWYIDQYILR